VLMLALLIGLIPANVFAVEEKNPFEGKTVSILSASTSTYAGVSNNTADNSTIGSNAVYYTEGRYGVYRKDTWWQQAIDALGMRLLVNNSWSGSCVFQPRRGEASVGYGDRAINLHNDHTGEEPDIIWVYLGGNDFAYYKDTFGKAADVDYAALIKANSDRTFTYAEPKTTCEAYAIMLHKAQNRYPDAQIYCMTSIARRDPDYTGDNNPDAGQPTEYNAELVKVAEHMGLPVIDIENVIRKEAEIFDKYIGDKRVHPNALGMDMLTNKVISVMLGKNSEICHVISENGVVAEQAVLLGGSYNAEIRLDGGYVPVVTMDGKDITAEACQDGKITIGEVTGEITITATVNRQPMHFSWEIVDDELTSVGTSENPLKKLTGEITEGFINDGSYKLATPVILKHDCPWVVEWKCAGDWRASVFSSDPVPKTKGADYLSRTKGGQLCFGSWTGTQYDNFGVDISYVDDQIHTYRLENRVAMDGSNMVWLSVDNAEIGPMNNYFVGSNSQSTMSDWISGRDFVFSHIGTENNKINNCQLEYLSVWENTHSHIYTSTVTAPTCTEQGYTAYVCNCGHSYADGYTDATGHNYVDGICTACGAEDPDAAIPISMKYDDRLDMTGKTVEILNAGIPVSYQVGYGVEGNTVLDTAVVALNGNSLVATGIGTATLRIDGQLCKVTVTAAPISLFLLIGQSNMRGSEGNADQSIVCPDGMVYATFGDDRGDAEGIMKLSNATNFAASALTGEYSTVNVNGTTENLSYYPLDSLTEGGKGTFGPDSGFAYEWVQQTGEKVWVVNAAHGGSSITSWQPDATNFKEAVALFGACQETLRKEIAAGHFTLSHMGYFWCQGCSDYSWTAEKYVTYYLTMHNALKSSLEFDHDSNIATAAFIFEFAGIIPVRTGHDYNDGYREGTYTDTTSQKFYESFKDLQMTGPRVAQYWMCNNPELDDIWMVCNAGEDWVWMPDGTNGVTEYFRAHYEGGTVDYKTQVQQPASWYTPTTPKAVHDSIHYNQIGYNEIGREAVRNTLIMLGELEAPEVETTVELLTWDGYTPADQISASLTGKTETLVMPKIYPLWKTKDVTFTISEGLSWVYYDLLVQNESVDGSLTMGSQRVTVTGHHWSDWETVREASAEGPGLRQRTCSHCGGTETEEVQGVWQIYALNDHLLELPENICCDTNLWAVLPHEDVHFTSGKTWGKTGTPTTSVTIPVNPGDRIYATSWNKAGENGHATADGIRLTFFNADGIALTLGPGESYRKFAANGGYLVAPEGTIAVNIVMWYDSELYEIYILNREHCYNNGVCQCCGHTVGPVITGQPGNVKVSPGEEFNLAVEAEGEGLTWQWYYRDAGMEDFAPLEASGNTCSGVMTEKIAGREIYCVITDSQGYSVTTDTVILSLSVLPGDINGDGKLNNKDVTRLMQFLAGWEVEAVAAPDINGDGKLNNKDVTRLMQYLAGWEVEICGVAS